MGAKVGLMPVDDKTLAWLKPRVPKGVKIDPLAPDKGAKYEKVLEFDVSKLQPQVSCPHTVDNVAAAEAMKSVKINEAYLGTCTNGRLQDLKIAAGIIKGRKVAKDVRFIVAASSRAIYLEALKLGMIDTFVRAGAVVVAPGCGPCVGTHNGIPADGEAVISTANRNFKGRMGNPNAFIYLASPATVAASAITGRITDPRKYL
jgi:3-isopropylmalate/(R)-2-methylmalate dehydratase large subunit